MGGKGNRFIVKLMLLCVFFWVSAASYEGYFAKWAFRDDSPKIGFTAMVEGSAHRPFAYRRLLPATASFIGDSLPVELRTYLTQEAVAGNFLGKTYKRATAIQPQVALQYYLLYGLSFLCYFAGILVLRQVCVDATGDRTASTLAALGFALVFPLLQTVGGYYYDGAELLFFAAAVALAWRGRWAVLLLLAGLAEFNKESFLLFLITLYPLLRRTQNRRFTAGVLLAAGLVAGFVYLGLKVQYAGTPGGAVEWHLAEQVRFFLQPANLFQFEINYGVPTGKGFFFLHLLFLAVIVRTAWPRLGFLWKGHVWLALAVNLPLFLVFGFPGELRNLSMLYVPFTVMSAVFLSRAVRGTAESGGPRNRLARVCHKDRVR